MLFRYFFWDFDGTLFDTYPRVTRAFQKGLADLGVDMAYAPLFVLVKRSLACAAKECARIYGCDADEALSRYHAHAEEEGDESMRPYPGAPEALRAVCARGGRNYLYTHRGQSGVDAVARYGLADCFADYVTNQDGFPSKPAPDALLYLMQKHALPARDCVMIGDRDIDVEAGKNAGMAGALFDPDGLYAGYPAQYRFADMQALANTLVDEKICPKGIA